MPATVYIVCPMTDEARDWLHEHLDAEATWFGKGVAVEWRYLDELAEGLHEAGFELGVDYEVIS